MKILYTGTDKRCREFEERFSSSGFDLVRFNYTDIHGLQPKFFDVIFDLEADDYPERFASYALWPSVPVVLCAVKKPLLPQTIATPLAAGSLFFGMNALPTFIHRNLWEIAPLGKDSEKYFTVLQRNLGISFIQVPDRAGMVTPRVIFMIINEAYYTFQEGTASKNDIDTAMKLGTNYPYGPFEWATQIGIRNVYETLAAVYEETKDERYRICPALRKEYLEHMALKTAILKS
jgi:3-hydroxybutyryl-CoA dehydrogenase